jgi:hypothetical protein
MENDIIARTKAQITKEDQQFGKLITRTPEDAKKLIDASEKFFKIINAVCKQAVLASMVADIPSNISNKRHREALQGKNMLATTSFPISKQIDDTLKRARCILQRVGILLRSLTNYMRNSNYHAGTNTTKNTKWIKQVKLSIKRLLNQQQPFNTSISALA